MWGWTPADLVSASTPPLSQGLWVDTSSSAPVWRVAIDGVWVAVAGGGVVTTSPTSAALVQTLPALTQQMQAAATEPTLGVLAQHLPALTQAIVADASASTSAVLVQTLPTLTQALAATVPVGETVVWWSDFSEMTTDAAPAGMTVRLAAGTSNWLVREKAGTTGGKTLEFTGSTNADRMLAVDAAGLVEKDVPVEVVVRARSTSAIGIRLGAAARAEDGAATLYTVRPGNAQVTANRYNAGTFTKLHGVGSLGTITENNWYWTRLRVEDAVVKSKFWNGTAEDEPGTPTTEWSDETTDAAPITAAGYAGLFLNVASGTQDVDVLGVAVGGPSAPKTDPDP